MALLERWNHMPVSISHRTACPCCTAKIRERRKVANTVGYAATPPTTPYEVRKSDRALEWRPYSEISPCRNGKSETTQQAEVVNNETRSLTGSATGTSSSPASGFSGMRGTIFRPE